MNKRLFLIADWFAFVIMPVLLWVVTLISGNDHMYKEWGSMSMNVLYLIMFMKPLIVIAGYRIWYTLLPYRRQLGMIAFWLAAFHTGGLIVAKNLWNISTYLTNPLTNYLFIGVFAMLGMVILAATSNFYSIKKLGKNWKKIQWLAYPVLFLGKLHGDLSKGIGGPRWAMGDVSEWVRTIRNTIDSTNTAISYTRYIPTLILLVIFIILKFRQHKIQTKQRRTIKEIIDTSQA